MSKFSAKELLDSGLLGEINRVILHPLGLAMGVPVDEYTEEAGDTINITKTDDLEGVIFEEEQLKLVADKLHRFLKSPEMRERKQARFARLGYLAQPGMYSVEEW